MSNKTLIICCAFAIQVTGYGGESREIIIARGMKHGSPQHVVYSEKVTYHVKELGRGMIPYGPVDVYYEPGSYIDELPSDAILLLQGPYGKSHQTGHIRIELLSREADRGILPYSEQMWGYLKKAPLEEISDSPAQERISPDQAKYELANYLSQQDDPPTHIYMYTPYRTPFGWTLNALYSERTAVMSITAWISDRRRIQVFRNQPRLVRIFREYKKKDDITESILDGFISEVHEGKPFEEWPQKYTISPTVIP